MGWYVDVEVPYEGTVSHFFNRAHDASDYIKFHYMPGGDYYVTVRPDTVEYDKTKFLDLVESGVIE